MKLSTRDLRLGYGSTVIFEGLSVEVKEGAVTSLVGRNGSGKSTLLRAMGRLLQPWDGAVLLDGRSIAEVPTREVARELAILPQGPTAPEGMTVRDLVEHGRYPHRQRLASAQKDDERAIAWALDETGMRAFANRPLERLSGGQRQRAWIAMALAQETGIILLDEPTTFLDVAYQIELMELLRKLNAQHGTTILMVLHDLNQAARYSDWIVAVHGGEIHSQGPPAEILTVEMARNVFGIESEVVVDAGSGAPMCIARGLAVDPPAAEEPAAGNIDAAALR